MLVHQCTFCCETIICTKRNDLLSFIHIWGSYVLGIPESNSWWTSFSLPLGVVCMMNQFAFCSYLSCVSRLATLYYCSNLLIHARPLSSVSFLVADRSARKRMSVGVVIFLWLSPLVSSQMIGKLSLVHMQCILLVRIVFADCERLHNCFILTE